MTLVFKPNRRADTAPKTAFVLSGGGNHGCAQVGMLRALFERGIHPDVVIGTSAGALNGSGVSANPSPGGVEHLATARSALRTEHSLAGPVDRIYVLNVSGGVADAPVRNPLDVVLRAFAIARNQRFERELASAPPHVEIVVLPRPADGRSPFDFSGAETIIDEAHILAGRFLDARTPGRDRPRRRFRRAHHAAA